MPVRPSGRGGGESQGNPMGGGECHLFLAGNRPAFCSVGNRMTSVAFEKEVFPLENIIYKWKEKVQWNTELSFWWKVKSSIYEVCLRGLHLCCVLPRTRSAYRWSSQHLAKVSTPNTAELMPSGFFFSVHNHGFCCGPNPFSQEERQRNYVNRHLVTGKKQVVKLRKGVSF